MTEKGWSALIISVSVLVTGLVALLFYIQLPARDDITFEVTIFPRFHAILNSLTAIMISVGVFFIKRGNVKVHRLCMLTAFGLSSVFLVSYVIYHGISESTSYGGQGAIRYVYYTLLISHIILAATILPLILFTFMRALRGQIEKHRKLARWTFPLWLYVAVSGVLVYIMISPYYGT